MALPVVAFNESLHGSWPQLRTSLLRVENAMVSDTTNLAPVRQVALLSSTL